MSLRIGMVAARAVPFMGGIETHVHEVSRRLAATGVEVTVLTTDTTGELARSETTSGYRVRRWPAYPRSRDYYFAPGLMRHLLGAKGDYDVVHMQGVHTLVPPEVLTAARWTRTPAVLTLHTGGNSSEFRESMRRTQFRVLAPLLRSADAVVAVCEYERRKFAEILGIPAASIRLIRNGSEPLPVDPSAPGIEGSPLLVSVGRLEEYKGHHRVLKALPLILQSAPGATLAVIGSGPFEGRLRDMAAELGVSDHVVIRSYGPLERGALGKVVSSADVMCLLSDYEAHPIAVMEALGTGTPALVADNSGMTELGAAGLATTIPVDSPPAEVAARVLQLAGAPRAAPPKLQTWDDCAEQLHDLYRAIARR